MYREGRIVPKDEIKALAWFTNAGNHGYPQSMVLFFIINKV